MRRRTQIIIAGVLFLLAGGAVAAYAYDGSTKGEIAEGVTISGIDVSGMSRAEAEQTVRSKILSPRRKPVTVTFKNEKFILPAKKLKIRADVEGAVNRALEAGRSGSLPARILRQVTGDPVNAAIAVDVAYSRPAVNQFVREVAEGVYRAPVNASVEPGPGNLTVVKAADGHKLRDNLLTDQLKSVLDTGRGGRTIKAEVNMLKPEVPTGKVADSYPVYLTLDRSSYQLKLWKNLKLAKTYTVAVGKIGQETPVGLYDIVNKQVDPAWHVPNSDWAGDLAGTVVPGGVPGNPLKARWMGIYAGAGIHGTSDEGSLGSAASHGCIRMSVPEVIELYDQVPVGTPIYIG